VAHHPTVYIVCSNQHRIGKTLLARLLMEYLMLDGLDPVGIDTDAPAAPLRNYFPGRTRLADFKQIQGRMKVFDTILASPGRDYVIDLPQRFTEPFFDAVDDLRFFKAAHEAKFRIFVFYVVDHAPTSVRAARETAEIDGIDLFVPVHNVWAGSAWPQDEGELVLPDLPQAVIGPISDRRFSIRNFVMGDNQNLAEDLVLPFKRFLYEVLQSLNDLEPGISLRKLRS
jgi:hypothetical protein